MKPTLRQLEYLVAIADTGRFSDAAERLNVAQPSLSTQVADAETQLGATLFERSRAGAYPTPIGEQVIRRARYILRQMEDLKAIAAHGETGLFGRVRLGVLPTIGPYLLPRCTKPIHARFPELRLSINDAATDRLASMLEQGLLDAAVSTLEDHPGCEGVTLFSERLWIAVEPEDPLAATSQPVQLDDLKERGFLTLGLGHRLTKLVQQLAYRAGGYVASDYEGTSLDAIRHMAALGAGIAVLPDLYVQCEARRDDSLVFRPIEDPRANRDIALVWRRNSPIRDGLELLAEIMRDAARGALGQQKTRQTGA